MNLTEKTSRDKNTNVTDSLANRTLIVTTILVRRKVKQRTAQGDGGRYIWDVRGTDKGDERKIQRKQGTVGGSHFQERRTVSTMNTIL